MNPRQHIEHLHQEKAVNSSISKDLSRSLDMLANNVFGEVNRFIFELLQNADDSPPADNRQVEVTFRLTKNYLTFSHNGKHFTPDDVTGISSVASRTSQKDKDHEKTGYKGIGFKSVFGSSDEVHIISGGYSFRYDKNYSVWQGGEYPWQVIPIWTEEPPSEVAGYINAASVNTVIKVNSPEIINREIKSVFEDCQIILFLRHVHRVNYFIGDKLALSIQKTTDKNQSIQLYKNASLISTWLTTDFLISIPAKLHDALSQLPPVQCPDRLKNAMNTRLTFAARIDGDSIVEAKASYLYCYLPTKVNKEFMFIINGDFITNAERTDITPNIWNEFLFRQIAHHHLLWLKEFATTIYRNQILKLFRSRFTFSNLSIVDRAFNEALKIAVDTVSFLPNIHNKNLIRANECLVDSFNATELFNANEIIAHLAQQRSFLPLALESTSAISDYSKNFSFDDICRFIVEAGAQQKQPQFFAHAIFLFFNNTIGNKNSAWISKIKELAFIPDANFQLKTPRSIFYPVQVDTSISQDFDTISFINADVYKLCQQYPSVIQWLSELGIKEPRDVEIVRKTIIPIIERNGITTTNALPITKFIYKVFRSGQLNDLDYQTLKKIKVLTPIGLQASTICYLPDKFLPAQKLTHILSKSSFVDESYGDDGDDFGAWGELFRKLDVKDNLSITVNPTRIERNSLIQSRPYTESYFEWLDKIGAYPDLYFSYRNNAQHFISNFTDIPFRAYLSDYKFSRIFWKQMLQNWEPFKAQCDKSVYHYYGGKSNTIPSYVEYYIKNHDCIPCTDSLCHKSQEVFSPNFKGLVNKIFSVADLDITLTKEQQVFFGFKNEIKFPECLEILNAIALQPWGQEGQRQAFTVYDYLIQLAPETDYISKIEKWREKGMALSQNNTFQPVRNLFCFRIPSMDTPINSEQFLKVPDRMSVAEQQELCNILQVPYITYEKLTFDATAEHEEQTLKQNILSKIPVLSLLVAQKIGENTGKITAQLQTKIENTVFRTASILHLKYSHVGKEVYSSEIDAWAGDGFFTFKGDWNTPLRRHSISNHLCALLSLTGYERDIELLLQLSPSDVRTWLLSKGLQVMDFEQQSFLHDYTELETQDSVEPKFSIDTFQPAVAPSEFDYAGVQAPIKSFTPAALPFAPKTNIIEDSQTRIDIGRWSEEFVYNYLVRNTQTFSDVVWLNEKEETSMPYDITMVENGQIKYIEVKGSPSDKKGTIYISKNEWKKMFEHQENYLILRVYNAGIIEARIDRIENPLNLLAQGLITAFPMELLV